MSNSTYILNQRISNIQTEINEIISGVIPVPSSSTLSQVLTNGNDGGGKSITNVNQITCNQLNYTTLNPPVSGGSQNLSQVLTTGNSANNTITLTDTTNSNALTVSSITISTGTNQLHGYTDNSTAYLDLTDGTNSNQLSSTEINYF